MSVKEQIDRIEAAKSSLKTAIEGKGVTVPSTTKIDGYGALVESIPAGIDTSDGTLAPGGMLKDMVGYSEGQKVTGVMQNFSHHTFDGSSPNLTYDGIPIQDVTDMAPSSDHVQFIAQDVIFPVRSGGQETTPVVALEPGTTKLNGIIINVPKSKFVETFGDATPADVVKNKLFMGAEGYAYGTLEALDTSDATATASDILESKTAYVDGQKVTGTMEEISSLQAYDPSLITVSQSVMEVPVILGNTSIATKGFMQGGTPGTIATANISLAIFGEAKASDVLKGKTFTSLYGYILSGTYEPPEAAKETWVLNDVINTTTAFSFSASFTSNGVSYTSLETGITLLVGHDVRYVNSSGYNNVYSPDAGRWLNQAYRKLIFDSPASGDLLTWLQANGLKQETGLAIQPTKSVTITSNGGTSITPDVPYDAMAKVDVTVDVAGSGTCKLQLVVTTPPTNSEGWSLNVEPLYFDDTTITLDANHLSVEIDISPNRLLLLSTDEFIDSVGTNGWGQFDTLNMATAYIEYDWGDTKAYVGYAGATGTGRWEIVFR